MSPNLSGLDVFAERGVPTTRKRLWLPPAPSDFAAGNVLAYDQSFAATGVVRLVSEDGTVRVTRAETVKTSSAKKGAEQDLDRAQQVYEAVTQEMRHRGLPQVIVYETPPKGHGVRHPEVSLLCALAIRLAADAYNVPFATVHSTTAKMLVTGNAKADKRAAHAGLVEHCQWIEGGHLVTNESQRDALLVGLAYLRKKEA